MSILLITDGSCSSVDMLGSWGAVIATKESVRTLYGIVYPSTVSRCELLPIIEGLRVIYYDIAKKQKIPVKLVSDSEYTIKSINGLYLPNKNKDLWDALEFFKKHLNITAIWRERNSHPYMELCDSIANAARLITKEELHNNLLKVKVPALDPDKI